MRTTNESTGSGSRGLQAKSESRNKRIYVAGHRGLVGSAVVRALTRRGYGEIVTRTHEELDLANQAQVSAFFESEMIDEVYLAAARVGGIYANNTFPAEFIYQNLIIEANLIHHAWRNGIRKMLFLGSSCIYPRLAPQPMREEYLLSGALEPTNEPYAIAKIAGIKLCESYNRQYGTDYRSVMPTNLYGPGDNYHPENSHVIPALIQRFHQAKQLGAKQVVIWGTGAPLREFLYVDDLADACVHVLDLDRKIYAANTEPTLSHVNVGTGDEVSIRELAQLIGKIVGYSGHIEFDSAKPDGTPRKLLDISRLRSMGWAPNVGLEEGLIETYQSFTRTETQKTKDIRARGLDRISRQRRQEFIFQRPHPIPAHPGH